MRTKAIRPAENRADHQPNSTTTTSSNGWKTCRQCGICKPLADMAVDSTAKGGRRSVCKECRTGYDSARYQAKRELILAQQRKYRQANRGVGWRKSHRWRSLSYGLVPVGELITEEALIERWGSRCVYCGGPFEQTDHFIAVRVGGPHLLWNVVPCCRACNLWKRWAIDEPLIRLHDALQALDLPDQVVDLDLVGVHEAVL